MFHLMDFVNASKVFYIRTTWGYKNETTGIYSGMIGDLQTGISDMGGKLFYLLIYFLQNLTT